MVRGLLGNTNFYDHGEHQDGTVKIVARSDPSTDGLPKSWPFRDEWYNARAVPDARQVPLAVDEKTLATRQQLHPGHGDLHPVAWCQYYDGGRAWLTTLGHDAAAFTEGSEFPGQREFEQLVVNGIKSAMGLIPFCTNERSGRDVSASSPSESGLPLGLAVALRCGRIGRSCARHTVRRTDSHRWERCRA